MSVIKLSDQVYHVGDQEVINGLGCNPYLIIEGEEALLLDPGSVLDFEIVLSNLKTLIDLEKIKYIVLHHQDPDFCSAVPLMEKAGVKAEIITSWRTMTLLQYYGIQSPYYLIEEHNMELVFQTGRTLEFIMTPYLHFSGAFITFDKKDKLLFSSDLFGAFSHNQTIFADDDYLHKMLTFHEHYMPSNSILRPIMDIIYTYDINMILPQHGSFIKDKIKDYILALRMLECGTELAPLKKNLMKSGGYLMIYNEINRRLRSIYPANEVDQIFKAITELELNESGEIVDYHSDGELVWNSIFTEIKKQQGMIWITVIEPFIRNLSIVYDIKLPYIFNCTLDEMASENQKLRETNVALDQTVKAVKEKLIRCPITGLYNEVFLKSLLAEELDKEDWRNVGDLVSISVDGFSTYQLNYGLQEEENVLKNLAYLFKETFGDNSVYRLESIEFALYIKGIERNDLIEQLDKLRISISKSNLFLGSLTISGGIAFHSEIELDNPSLDLTIENYMDLSLKRVRIAKAKGKNMICADGDTVQAESICGTVLVVDSDETNLELLKNFIGSESISVLTAKDGLEAYEMAVLQKPKVIISELILNKMDGFVLREQILQNSETKNIETILLSYKKDEESVERAISLGVTYYLKKPYMLSELVGIVKRKVKGTGAK